VKLHDPGAYVPLPHRADFLLDRLGMLGVAYRNGAWAASAS
jgi:hypothetical protein